MTSSKQEFIICIEELISKNFIVNAKNKEEAMKLAIKKYDSCEFIVDAEGGVVEEVKIAIENEDGEFENFINI